MTLGLLRSNFSRMILGGLILVMLIWIGTVGFISSSREKDRENHLVTADRLVQFFEDNTVQIFSYADSYVKFVRHEFLDHSDINQITELMAQAPLDKKIVSGITIIDAEGNVLFVSGLEKAPDINVKDRDYFQFQEKINSENLSISQSHPGRGSGKPTVRLVRPILDENGQFDGVIIAAIEVKRIVSFFDDLNEGHDSSAMLVGMDRVLRAHSKLGMIDPNLKLSEFYLWDMLEEADQGNYVHKSSVDQISRYYSFRKIKKYPLLVVIGQALVDSHGIVDKTSLIAYGFAIFSTFVVGVLFFFIRRENLNLELIRSKEERIRDFAESASDWFWEMDDKLRFTYFSKRNKEITGTDPEIFIGKTRREIAGEEVKSEKWKRHLDDLENHRVIRDFTYDLVKGDGDKLAVSITGKPVYNHQGVFKGYRGTGSDFTLQMRAREKLNLALHDAESANRTKSEFLANMSHELRTPLNAIIGYSSGLLSGVFGKVKEEKHEEYLGHILQSGEFLLELISDILDISKIEAGEIEIDPVEIDLVDLLNSCMELVQTRVDQAGHDLTIDIPTDFPKIRADKRHIQQIVLNLLSNSIKFTPNGGEILVRGVIEQNNDLLLVILDNGEGVSQSNIAEILKPFGQVANAMTKHHEGSGLGLSIAKSLTELNGASFRFESEINVGTTVTIRFSAIV